MAHEKLGIRRVGRRAWCAAVLAVCLTAGSLPLSAGELLDRVLAVVSGTVVTLSDARVALAFGAVDASGAPDGVAVALRWLIDRQLVLDEVNRYDTTEVAPARVAERLAAIRARYPSEQAFAEGLTQLGLDQTAARAWVRDTVRVEEYLLRRFDAVFPATDEELQDFLARNPARFTRGGAVPAFSEIREIRAEVLVALQEERRRKAVETWLSRLRRRAEITEIYAPAR
jgi:hypothetical protein